jgi:hypothetical protein
VNIPQIHVYRKIASSKIKTFIILLEEPLGKSGCQYTSIWNVGRGKQIHEVLDTPPVLHSGYTDRLPIHTFSSVCLSTPLTSCAEASAQGMMGRSQLRSQRSESVACAWFLNDDCIHALKECLISYRKRSFRYLTFLNISGEGGSESLRDLIDESTVSDIHLYRPLLLNNIAVGVGYFLYRNATSQ